MTRKPAPDTHDAAGEWRTDVHVDIERIEEAADASPGSLLRTIRLLDRAAAAIPEEHRAAARLSLELSPAWGSCRLWYERPATDEEIAATERWRAEDAEERERQERTNLARLKARYEGGDDTSGKTGRNAKTEHRERNLLARLKAKYEPD